MIKKEEKRWYPLLARLPKEECTAAEIGVWKCYLSKTVLAKHSKLILTLVDPWKEVTIPEGRQKLNLDQNDLDKMYDFALSLNIKYPGRCNVIRDYSVNAANTVEDVSLDLVFIDGDHSYNGVIQDIEAWRNKVKPGGWLGGHDYGPRFPGVIGAVNETFGSNVELDTDDTWWIKL